MLLYDGKYLKNPRKLQMHWLGPFQVVYIRDLGEIHLAQLNGVL